jgi:hypothetical protein
MKSASGVSNFLRHVFEETRRRAMLAMVGTVAQATGKAKIAATTMDGFRARSHIMKIENAGVQ